MIYRMFPQQRILRENFITLCARELLPENSMRLKLMPIQVGVLTKSSATIRYQTFARFLAGMRKLMFISAACTKKRFRAVATIVNFLARMTIQMHFQRLQRKKLLATIFTKECLALSRRTMMTGKFRVAKIARTFVTSAPSLFRHWMFFQMCLQQLKRSKVLVA